jgi:hypothetical protein
MLSPADKSALRRCAGQMMNVAERAGAYMAYHRAMREVSGSIDKERAFAALCMQMLWREEDHPEIVPMEEILRDMIRIGTDEENSGLLNRVRAALDTKWAQDGFLLWKICNLARIIRAAHPERMPNFAQLYQDLRNWNTKERWVQRKWVRVIFMGAQTEAGEQEDQGGNAE